MFDHCGHNGQLTRRYLLAQIVSRDYANEHFCIVCRQIATFAFDSQRENNVCQFGDFLSFLLNLVWNIEGLYIGLFGISL